MRDVSGVEAPCGVSSEKERLPRFRKAASAVSNRRNSFRAPEFPAGTSGAGLSSVPLSDRRRHPSFRARGRWKSAGPQIRPDRHPETRRPRPFAGGEAMNRAIRRTGSSPRPKRVLAENWKCPGTIPVRETVEAVHLDVSAPRWSRLSMSRTRKSSTPSRVHVRRIDSHGERRGAAASRGGPKVQQPPAGVVDPDRSGDSKSFAT